MKKIIPLALLAIPVLLAPLAVAGPAAAAQGPLTGTWYSIDAADGSEQVLSVVGSGKSTYSVFVIDTAATVCDGAPAKVVGTGTFQDGALQTVGTLTCKPYGNILRFRIPIDYSYDPGADTLTDDFGSVWTR